MRKLPEGAWTYSLKSGIRPELGRYVISAKHVELFQVNKLIDAETTDTALQLITGLRNSMPQLVIDMAKLTGVSRILNVTREVAGDGQTQPVNDVEFTAQLAEALEAFRRAESVVPREPGERMTAWVERVVYRLLVLEKLASE